MDVLVNVEMTIVVDHKGSTIQGFRAPVLKVGQDVTANVREDLNVFSHSVLVSMRVQSESKVSSLLFSDGAPMFFRGLVGQLFEDLFTRMMLEVLGLSEALGLVSRLILHASSTMSASSLLARGLPRHSNPSEVLKPSPSSKPSLTHALEDN